MEVLEYDSAGDISADQKLMRERRENNDKLKANNCVTNISATSGAQGHRMGFSQPMSSIIRLDVAKMLKQRFSTKGVKTVSIQQLLQVISDFKEFKAVDIAGHEYTFRVAFDKMVAQNYPLIDGKYTLFKDVPYGGNAAWNLDKNWIGNLLKWQMIRDPATNILQTHITNIAPYVIEIAVGRLLFRFLGFELLKTTSDQLKAVIWQRFEECCQGTTRLIEGEPNDPGMEDNLEFIPERWIGGVKACENVATISPTANTLVGEDCFLYSNNAKDVFLGDKYTPLMAIIPAFGSTLGIENNIFSYEPETALYCELNGFSLTNFHFVILNARGEAILVKAVIDLQFRLIGK